MRMRATFVALLMLLWGATLNASLGAAAAADCAGEADALVKDESELPQLDVASRADRPILCITLETVMAFAGRLKSHVAHCPKSTYAAAAAEWEKTRTGYSKLFAQNRCRPTLRN
ncbi:MAG: hypothetical protein QOC56_2594 [Alphaproteobacteria bacterium]|nr:hypothetical protein [Alphaproteobacteria bacterium]